MQEAASREVMLDSEQIIFVLLLGNSKTMIWQDKWELSKAEISGILQWATGLLGVSLWCYLPSSTVLTQWYMTTYQVSNTILGV